MLFDGVRLAAGWPTKATEGLAGEVADAQGAAAVVPGIASRPGSLEHIDPTTFHAKNVQTWPVLSCGWLIPTARLTSLRDRQSCPGNCLASGHKVNSIAFALSGILWSFQRGFESYSQRFGSELGE